MISDGIEGHLKLDVGVGQTPIQDLADVYTNFAGHKIIIYQQDYAASIDK
jgi:hypothetical protein